MAKSSYKYVLFLKVLSKIDIVFDDCIISKPLEICRIL